MAAKTIEFSYDGHDIKLAYTHNTVRELERAGLKIDDIGDMPITTTELLFQGAFLANHRKVKTSTINEIWKHIPQKEDFVKKLLEMYNETRDTLFDEPDEADEKNVDWKASW